MKYLRQENSRFIFEDGGEEIGIERWDLAGPQWFRFKNVYLNTSKGDVGVNTNGKTLSLKDIQTSVQMMTILKDKGLV